LCIFPHDGALPYDQIQDFIHPPVAWYRRSRDEALLEREPAPQPREISAQPFVSVSHPALHVTMVKKAEEGDALVVRVLNLSNEAVTGSVCLSPALGTFGQVAKVNLEERILEALGTGNCCQIACRSKEVATLRFER
jgi:alpha-mannosidase